MALPSPSAIELDNLANGTGNDPGAVGVSSEVVFQHGGKLRKFERVELEILVQIGVERQVNVCCAPFQQLTDGIEDRLLDVWALPSSAR